MLQCLEETLKLNVGTYHGDSDLQLERINVPVVQECTLRQVYVDDSAFM